MATQRPDGSGFISSLRQNAQKPRHNDHPHPNPQKRSEQVKLTVFKSQNGWLVIWGDCDHFMDIGKSVTSGAVQAFNSLDKAVSYLRAELKSWHPKQTAVAKKEVA